MTTEGNPVAYETLIRFALISDRLNELAQEFHRLDSLIGGFIGEHLGLRDVPGPYSDHILEEFDDAVSARRRQEEDGDG